MKHKRLYLDQWLFSTIIDLDFLKGKVLKTCEKFKLTVYIK